MPVDFKEKDLMSSKMCWDFYLLFLSNPSKVYLTNICE